MLPDFPELKRRVDRRIVAEFNAQRAATIHVFEEVPKFCLHQGKRLIIVRADGVEGEAEIKQLRVESSISRDEYDTLSPHELAQRVTQAGIEMGRKQLELAYAEINQAVTATGNVVATGGKPVGPEHILQVLETVQIDFDQKGRPKFPTIVAHPDSMPQFKEAVEAIERNADLRTRCDRIICAKKEEWRARESNRKLVG